MPTYDYECNACGHEFELFQSIKDAVKRKCPECGRLKLRRLIGSGGAVMFKGSGFYQTDYRSDAYKKKAKADKQPTDKSADGKSSDKKSTSSGDTKSTSSDAKKSD